jgi:hypothetical protein
MFMVFNVLSARSSWNSIPGRSITSAHWWMPLWLRGGDFFSGNFLRLRRIAADCSA